MDPVDKRARIDQYFESMDEADPSLVRSSLADGFVYIVGNGTRFTGKSAIGQYIEEVRTLSETWHDIKHIAHGETASFTEGIVSGISSDGNQVEVGFCDVFQFDEDANVIDQVTVYINEK